MILRREKIAVVGMAFRFPGGLDNSAAFWQALKEGKDLVTEIGDDRWDKSLFLHPNPSEPGKSYVFSAGQLDRIDEFDAKFFGISPREAAQIDPQQRLLLELVWEALDDGGQRADLLEGSQCAVYIGIASNDYSQRRLDDLATTNAYTMTGNTASIASNRISYVFDLHGPSMSVDTACSSSLVAVHEACKSIWSGEAPMAIAGGVNMLLHPYPFVGFSKASMLSPTGRCRPFDAAGDGYVRSEGAGILFLKPLADAKRDGDPIHAVIVNSGVNSDGRTNGISLPSMQGQATLLENVYQAAGVDLNRIAYVEAHGTGTPVGDPIEAASIGSALGQKRAHKHTLPIGSIKGNLGHMETASGMAGIIKVIHALKYRAIPPSAQLTELNPNIDFDTLNLKVVNTYQELSDVPSPLLMGVNSFGFGGANAHVLLEEYLPPCQEEEVDNDWTPDEAALPPLYISAQNKTALAAFAEKISFQLKEHPEHYYDIAWRNIYKRSRLAVGAVITPNTINEAVEQLESFVDDDFSGEQIYRGRLVAVGVPTVFVYSGNGAQWQGMGVELLSEVPEFTGYLQEVDSVLRPLLNFSVLDELRRATDDSNIHLTEFAQPMLFALQVAITRWFAARGLVPDYVLGHSVGEISAAWASGALTLEDAARVIVERSAAQGMTRGTGRMAAVGVPLEELQTFLEEQQLTELVEVAGINSPASLTLAGQLAALNKVEKYCLTRQKFYRLLDLDYAFHSRYMDPIRDRIIQNLAGIKPKKTGRYISTVTGSPLAGRELAAEYWWQNIRKPVQFQKAIEAAMGLGSRIYMDIGPHPIMRSYINECVRAVDQRALVLPTLTREGQEQKSLLSAYYGAWMAGAKVEFTHCFPKPGRFVPMASYPWQRSRHWYETTEESFSLVSKRRAHPLLGARLRPELPLWEIHLDPQVVPYLGDHKVGGGAIMPGAGFVEMALAVAKDWYGVARFDLQDIEIIAPLLFGDEGSHSVRIELQPDSGRFSIKSRRRVSGDNWLLHCTGKICRDAGELAHPIVELSELRGGSSLSGATLYSLARRVGLDYGEAFQPIQMLWRNGAEAAADFRIPQQVQAGLHEHILHPALLDGCFQALAALLLDAAAEGEMPAFIPVRLGRLRFDGEASEIHHVRCCITRQSDRSAVADFQLLDDAGHVVAVASNCRFKAVRFSRSNGLPQLYRDVVIVANMAATSFFTLKQFTRQLKTQLSKTVVSAERQRHYDEFLPLSDALISRLAYQVLHQVAGPVFSEQELLACGGLAKQQVHLFRWLIAQLKEDELIQEQADGRFTLAPAPELSAEEIWRMLASDYRDYLPELSLLGRMVKQLPALLAAEETAEELGVLAPTHNTTEQLVQASRTYAGIRELTVQVLTQALAQKPARQNLAILEIGCENQQLMAPLLTTLAVGDCYCFGATESFLVAAAQTAHGKVPGFSAALFDINDGHSVAALGGEMRFDVICAPHILHRADDPVAVLAELKNKLKPGGLLLIAEQAPNRFTDLIEGIFPDWWARSNGQLHSRLLNRPQWLKALDEAGFKTQVGQLSDYQGAGAEGAFLLLAQREPASTEVRGEPQPLTGQNWVLLGGAHDHFDQLADACAKAGAQVTRVSALKDAGAPFVQYEAQYFGLNPERQADWQMLWQTMEGLPDKIIDLNLTLANTPFAAAGRCNSALSLSHSLVAFGDHAPQLIFVTQGAVATAERPVTHPAEAALWGMVRVMMNEHPEYRARLIDSDTIAELLPELAEGEESELVLAAGGRYVLRLQPAPLPVASDAAQDTEVVTLHFSEPGPLKNLKWFVRDQQPLAANQVAVRPRAVGLNFRDVMYAMGLLPDEALENGFSGPSLGMEMAGEVIAVGSAVEDFSVGDQVMGFAPACFSSRVVTESSALSRKPQDWTFADAATVPTTFFTAYYALVHLAKVQPGEKVLIHGGAGGVGLAAIQIAKWLKAEIYVTAGSGEKRDFVELIGADKVFDSRSLAFADQIMDATGGRGIDVVLNSLAGEAINRNLAILRPFGRFLELGKRDFYADTPIGLRPFRNNITYFGIDADQLMVEQPALTEKLFKEVMALFAEGALHPLPYRLFACEQIADAFRYMQQSKQIGKVVVDFAHLPKPNPRAADYAPLQFDQNATYLVSGGTSGFGLATAKWLVDKGARHIGLISRRGIIATEGMLDVAEAWGERNVAVIDLQLDLTNDNVVAQLEEKLRGSPPVKGIIHAATVIEDGLLRTMSHDALNRVLGPKIAGAWNLHEFSKERELDFFVLYSSATTCFGNPGQANYVAGNRYLEALAAWRRSQNLPALCLAWGAIDDVGFLARNEEIKTSLVSRLGGWALRSEQALAMLERALQTPLDDCAVLDISWPQMKRYLPAANQPRFSQLELLSEGESGEQGEDIRALLEGLSADEARNKVIELLAQEAGKILGLPIEEIDPALSVFEQGMDSLMGVEMALSIEARFAVHMPAMALADGPTLLRVADKILSQLDPDQKQAPTAADTMDMTLKTLASKHGSEISEDEMTALKRVLDSGEEG